MSDCSRTPMKCAFFLIDVGEQLVGELRVGLEPRLRVEVGAQPRLAIAVPAVARVDRVAQDRQLAQRLRLEQLAVALHLGADVARDLARHRLREIVGHLVGRRGRIRLVGARVAARSRPGCTTSARAKKRVMLFTITPMLLVRLLVPVFFLTPAAPSCAAALLSGVTAASADGVGGALGETRIRVRRRQQDQDRATRSSSIPTSRTHSRRAITPGRSSRSPRPTKIRAARGSTRIFRAAYPPKDADARRLRRAQGAGAQEGGAGVRARVGADRRSSSPPTSRWRRSWHSSAAPSTRATSPAPIAPSAHSYGIAIDLNDALSDYWRWEKSGWRNRIPQAIVDAFEAEGFIWGGRWYHFDTMHFEYRPELLDGSCYPPAP